MEILIQSPGVDLRNCPFQGFHGRFWCIVSECMPDVMIVLLNDNFHLCWCLRWFWNAFTIILNGIYFLNISGLCESRNIRLVVGNLVLVSVWMFYHAGILGLFRCGHSQIEGTRFPKITFRFLTFFDLEDFASLGIVFVITVHWGLLPLWFSGTELLNRALLTACLWENCSALTCPKPPLFTFSCHCMSLSSGFALLTTRQGNESERQCCSTNTTLFKLRLTKKMAD